MHGNRLGPRGSGERFASAILHVGNKLSTCSTGSTRDLAFKTEISHVDNILLQPRRTRRPVTLVNSVPPPDRAAAHVRRVYTLITASPRDATSSRKDLCSSSLLLCSMMFLGAVPSYSLSPKQHRTTPDAIVGESYYYVSTDDQVSPAAAVDDALEGLMVKLLIRSFSIRTVT
eukprot:COSAG02_NODE_10805_length_1855_cov_1.828588_1_plen_173_part_00